MLKQDELQNTTAMESIKVKDNTDFKELIRPAIFKQFNTTKFAINKVTFEYHNDAQFSLYYFETSTGIQSTVMVVKTGKQSIKVGNNLLSEDKEFIIDCTGSCNCRERYYPATGGVECTCSPCQMKVTEIVPEN